MRRKLMDTDLVKAFRALLLTLTTVEQCDALIMTLREIMLPEILALIPEVEAKRRKLLEPPKSNPGGTGNKEGGG
jgi:hypothetical protein